MSSSQDHRHGQADLKSDESRTYDMYEEIENLRIQLMRRNKKYANSTFSQWRLANKLRTDQLELQTFSTQLKQEFQRIFSLTCEANTISTEMQRHVIYIATLQTSVSYLKPNERMINNLCAPAIQVNRGGSTPQIWNIEKFEFKLHEMRKIYQQWKISENKNELLKRMNPFYDKEPENLIGVANIYLKALFYSPKLDYIVPIINIKGEISGSLCVTLDQTGLPVMKKQSDLQINSTTRSSMSDGISIDADEQSLNNRSTSQHSFEDEGIDESSTIFDGKNDQTTIKFAIKEARDLPESNAENVLCRYFFINPKLDQTALSLKRSNDQEIKQKSPTFLFDHKMEYTFRLTDTFRTTCLENSIPVEIWYQQNSKTTSNEPSDNDDPNNEQLRKVCYISNCWKDVKRHVQFIVEIHELDETGEWKPVQVDVDDRVISGGIYRLKQGQSKRVVTTLKLLPRSNALPFHIDTIRSVEIGSISTRKIDAPVQLDSYQEEDLQSLKQQWLGLIEKRKIHAESQLNASHQQTIKNAHDIQKENILLEELRQLAQEQDIAVLPPSLSGIPGSPAAWNPPQVIEAHRPLIFLDVDPFKMKPTKDCAGVEATLTDEDQTKMIKLPLIQNMSDEISSIALWDPSRHNLPVMNQVTPSGTLIYLIVKVIVIINEPIHMEIILRKRIAVTINKSDEWWSGKLVKSFLGYETYIRTSVVYEIVSNIPKSLYAVEDQIPADGECVLEENIQKYIHHASTIDARLLLDRLRQEVLLLENFTKQQTILKSTSAPNITSYEIRPNISTSLMTCSEEIKLPEINSDSKLNSSIPTVKSRLSFIEQQDIKPIQTSSPTIYRKLDISIDDDQQKENDDRKLDQKYPISASGSTASLTSNRTVDSAIENFLVGSQVIVNTGRSVVEKSGIIRYAGEIKGKKGKWYGVELREPLGKNNGTVEGHVYFECPTNHGVFVHGDKLRLDA
ncbi:hypothetical protein I4U23_013089 [Adineta vaga]|nr:hypothetical protein I4U23_013089 [Adineta vaga]